MYLHPWVTDADITSALKEYENHHPDNIEVSIMDKIFRCSPDEVEEMIQCNPKRNVKSRTKTVNLKQVYSTVIARFAGEFLGY